MQHHYAGEYLRIAVRARIEVTPGKLRDLLPADVDKATMTIRYRNSIAVDSANMDYDAALGLWLYHWDSSGSTPGTYEAKAFFEGEQHRSWEYGEIEIEADRARVVVR